MSPDAASFKGMLKSNWKPILCGLSPFLLLCIVFALPLKLVAVQTTEKYWTSELQPQPYVEQETYTDVEQYVTASEESSTVFDSYVSYVWSYAFKVPETDAMVKINLQGLPYYYYTQPYYYIDEDDYIIRFPPYYGAYYDGYAAGQKVSIKVVYPEGITRQRVVTKTRDVTRYRDVAVEVQKERVVTRYVRMPVWQYLFRDTGKKV